MIKLEISRDYKTAASLRVLARLAEMDDTSEANTWRELQFVIAEMKAFEKVM